MSNTIEILPHQFPEKLKRIQNPPKQLFYQGPLESFNREYLAVVGAREALPWALEWMEHELTPVLKSLNIGVISGGARGVDQKAHWLAVRAQRPTLVVLPSGLAHKYPRDIKVFENNENVGFLSEYHDDEEMKKYYFYDRNRIIAALCRWILIIQADRKSGTMITAQYAIDYGVPLMALPGHPLDLSMSGNNQLLFDGAQMIRNQEDLLNILSTNC